MLALDRLEDLAERGIVVAGKHVLLQPRIGDRRGVGAADELQHREPRLAQHLGDELVEARIALAPDMLEHADRGEFVAGFYVVRDVAVVVMHVLDAVGADAERLRALARERDLLAGNVERLDPDAVVARHVQRKPAPAAAGFDHQLARLQPQLAAHQIHLPDLRVLQRVGRPFEIGAGVLHLGIEPELIETVGEVVMRGDVLLRAGKRVAPRQQAEQVARALPQRTLEHALLQLIAHQRHGLQVALDVDLAARIGLAEAHRGPHDDVARGAAGLDMDGEGGRSLAVGRHAAVRKNDLERLLELQRVQNRLKPIPVHGRPPTRP